ncbi:cyclin-domain-containing protein [Pilobolus umbonatus]|nr:cyclin-domain-containing protein [Pilobolus umbonatus]
MSSKPFDLASHPTKDTIKILTFLLEKITSANDKRHSETGSLKIPSYTCFHARSIPSISIHAYFTRILKYCPCANECLIALLVYFDRMTLPNSLDRPPIQIDSYNIHRLIITGLMISSKLYSDVFFTNTRYAKVGGLPVAELNALELEFLCLNDYNVFVTIEELQSYGDKILEHWMSAEEIDALAIKSVDHHLNHTRCVNNEEDLLSNLGKLSMDTNSTYKSDSVDRQKRFSRPNFSLRHTSAGGTVDVTGDLMHRLPTTSITRETS